MKALTRNTTTPPMQRNQIHLPRRGPSEATARPNPSAPASQKTIESAPHQFSQGEASLLSHGSIMGTTYNATVAANPQTSHPWRYAQRRFMRAPCVVGRKYVAGTMTGT